MNIPTLRLVASYCTVGRNSAILQGPSRLYTGTQESVIYEFRIRLEWTSAAGDVPARKEAPLGTCWLQYVSMLLCMFGGCFHMVSDVFIWFQMFSYGFRCFHMIIYGFIWFQMFSYGYIWFHMVSYYVMFRDVSCSIMFILWMTPTHDSDADS